MLARQPGCNDHHQTFDTPEHGRPLYLRYRAFGLPCWRPSCERWVGPESNGHCEHTVGFHKPARREFPLATSAVFSGSVAAAAACLTGAAGTTTVDRRVALRRCGCWLIPRAGRRDWDHVHLVACSLHGRAQQLLGVQLTRYAPASCSQIDMGMLDTG